MASYEELKKQREKKQVQATGSAPYVNPQNTQTETKSSTSTVSAYDKLRQQRNARENTGSSLASQYGSYVRSAGNSFADKQAQANKLYGTINDQYKRSRLAIFLHRNELCSP